MTQAQDPDRGISRYSHDPRCQTVLMATRDGWYLIGPLIVVPLIGFVAVVFRRLGLQWLERADDPLGERYGPAIFQEPYDYGLLRPVAVCAEPETAEDIRHLLADAGIRATRAIR